MYSQHVSALYSYALYLHMHETQRNLHDLINTHSIPILPILDCPVWWFWYHFPRVGSTDRLKIPILNPSRPLAITVMGSRAGPRTVLPHPRGTAARPGLTRRDPQWERRELCGSRRWRSWRMLKEEKDERQRQRGKRWGAPSASPSRLRLNFFSVQSQFLSCRDGSSLLSIYVC